MSQLTWNNVAAPDFTAAMNGLRLASGSMNDAVASGQGVVQDIKSGQNIAADRQLQLNMDQYNDPDALAAAKADGSVFANINTNRLTPDQIASVPGRVTTLLGQKTTDISNKDAASKLALDTITRNIEGSDAQNMVAARPVLNDIIGLANDPNNANNPVAFDAAREKYYASNPNAKALIAKLPYAAQLNSAKDYQDLVRSGIMNFGSAQQNTQTGLGIQDTLDNRNGEAIAGVVRPLGGGIRDWGPILDDPKALSSALKAAGYNGPITQNAIERARRVLVGDSSMRADYVSSDGSAAGGGSGGGMPGGGGSVVPGGDPARVLNNVARGAGLGTNLPDNVKTMGDFSNWASQTNSRGVNSTAAGLYQIEGSTLRKAAPQALGANWQSMPFDAQNQDKVAQYIYDNNKGSVAALQKQWPSLTAAKAASLVNGKWEQARGVIAPGESGASEAMIEGLLRNQAGVVGTNTQITQNSANQPAQAAAQELLTRADDNSSANDLAVQLTGKGQPYEGNTVESVTRQIASFQHKYGGTAAQAAWALGQSKMGNVGSFRNFARGVDYSMGLTNNGTNVQSDNDKLDYYGQMIKNPKGMAAAAIAKTTGETAKSIVSNTNAQVMALSQQKYQAKMAAMGAGRQWTDANEAYWNNRISAAAGMASGALHVGNKVASYGSTAPDDNNDGGGQTPPPSVSHQPSTGNIPVAALNARAFLQRKLAEATAGAGPLQKPGIISDLGRQWHLRDISSINNPMVAWTVAKALDAATNQPGHPSAERGHY